MIINIEKNKLIAFLDSFDEDIKVILQTKCKFLFIENDEVYVVMFASEEEKAILRKAWATIKTKALTILEAKNLKIVLESEEKALFLEKAIDICNTKKVEISLA